MLARILSTKCQQLFEHYNLNYGDWEKLALALATDHVPGFQTVMKSYGKGRKEYWDDVRLFAFYVDFQNKHKQLLGKYPHRDYNDSDIARALSKNEYKESSVKTLLNIYNLSRKSIFFKIIKSLKLSLEYEAIQELAKKFKEVNPSLFKVANI